MKQDGWQARPTAAREVVAATALLLFVGLLGWEQAIGSFAFDLPVLRAVHEVSNPAIVEVSRWLAWAGYGYGVLPIDALIVIALLTQRRFQDAVFAFVALWGGLLVSALLKTGIQRVRPALDTVREVQLNYGFPSGHAMATAALTATAVALTWNTRWRWPVLVLTSLFALLVGIGRVHAGVHFPSDVLAGWVAGVGWTCMVHLLVHRRGQLGPSTN